MSLISFSATSWSLRESLSLSSATQSNNLFVCFAPYDDPEIAVAIVIEHATWGANAASTGVEILNAYFAAEEDGSPVTGENQLLP